MNIRPAVNKSGTIMWRSSDAYYSKLENGKWQPWQQMKSTGQAQANPLLWIYVTGGRIKLKT